MCYGFSNIDVSHEFSDEADWLKRQLGNFTPDIVVTSPLQRCVKLSVQAFDAPIEVQDKLKEVNYGDWEGKTWDEIDIEGDNLWMYNNVQNRPPNGESFAELQSRVKAAFNEIAQKKEESIAVVCHGGVIRSILSHLLSTPLDKTRSFDIHYVGFVKFELTEEGWRLVELNSGYK